MTVRERVKKHSMYPHTRAYIREYVLGRVNRSKGDTKTNQRPLDILAREPPAHRLEAPFFTTFICRDADILVVKGLFLIADQILLIEAILF